MAIVLLLVLVSGWFVSGSGVVTIVVTCVIFCVIFAELVESEDGSGCDTAVWTRVAFEDSLTCDTAMQARVAALRGARALARDKALAFLVRGLRHSNEEVQVAAITSIEALRLREAFEPMLSLSAEMGTTAVHTAAARALEASACVEDEALLLRTLCATSQSGELRMAAARALGAVGTGRAVETLRTFGRGIFSGAPGRAAKKAIEQIQSRLDGASAGQLSVADATGDLSFAQEAGSLCFCGTSARGCPRESQ